MHAALQPSAPDGLRPDARRPQGLSPVGKPDAGPSRAAPDPGRGGHDRAARAGHRECRGHGDRGAIPRRPLQPAGPRNRQPPDVLPRGRRRSDGRHLLGGRFARRAPEARQARVSLRRQPRVARRAHVAGVHRGRPAPLRSLRLAGGARRERQHEPGRHRRGDSDRALAGGPADDHRRAHDDRLRFSAQGRDRGRPRQPPRRRGSGADQEGARLGVDRGVLRAARGREALPHGGRARHEGRGRLGPALRGVGDGVSGPGRRVAHRAQGRAARRLGRGPSEVEGRATRWPRAWPAARP